MKWEDVGSIVGKFAPLVGSAFGPAGTIVGGLVSAALGVENTPEAITAEIRANPEAAMKIIEMQERNKGDLEKLVITAGIEHHKLDNQDIQSARARSMTPGFDNSRANWMIAGDILGLLSCLCAMLYLTWLGIGAGGGGANPIIMAANGPLGMLTQQFANGLRDAHQFEFGSSRGSKAKDNR
jgi:hypothetical protein